MSITPQGEMRTIIGLGQLSLFTGINQRTLARAVKVGLLPVTRVSRKTLVFREEDVIQWFANRIKAQSGGSNR